MKSNKDIYSRKHINTNKQQKENSFYSNPHKQTVLFLILIVILTIFVFSPVFDADFVNWDDDANIYENTYVRNFEIEKIFTTHVIGNYNPLTNLTFAIEYYFVGENPALYHINNLILHLINVILVYFIVCALGLKRNWALWVSLLFAIHPMHVESVAWITERKDVLFGMFYLLACIFYIKKLKTQNNFYWIGIYLCFILSLLSKIQAVSLPITLLLIDYLYKKTFRIRLIIDKIPLFLLSLLTGILGVLFLKEQTSLDSAQFDFFERFMIGTYSIVVYIIKSVIPYKLLPIYPYPKNGYLEWYFYVMPFIAIALGYLVYLTSRHSKVFVFGALFFLFNIIFVAQFVTAGQGFLADRFTYIPYIGVLYVMAYVLNLLYKKSKSFKFITPVIAINMGVVFLIMSYKQTQIWENSGTLFTHQLESRYKVPIAYHNRANYYRDLAEKFEKEKDSFTLKGLSLKTITDTISVLSNKAISDYSKLISLKPFESKSYVSRGKLYYNLKAFELSLKDFNTALKYDSLNAEAYSNRASIYGGRMLYEQALYDLNKALSIRPDMEDALLNRALLFYNMEKFSDAINDLNLYIAIVPENAAAIDLRGLCLYQIGDIENAYKNFEEAVKLKPSNKIYNQHRNALRN